MPTALVIGGTSGIGAAIARAFAAAGFDTTAAGLAPVEPDLPAVETLDVRDAAAIGRLAARFDRLDALAYAAGVIRRDAEFEADGFAGVLDVNLAGAMRVAQALHGALAAAKGAIVTVASMYSFFGAAHAPAYAASKGGIVQLTKSLAVAWAADGIRVNAVAPGWIRTELTAAVRQDPARERRILERTPMGRWGEPAEVADAVMFLVSPAARFITGVVLPVDGGYSVC